MHPNIQVAFISVLASCVTTLGVIIAAIINNRKGKALSPGVGPKSASETDILDRMLNLTEELTSCQNTVEDLRARVRRMQADNRRLRAQLPPESIE